MIVYLVPQVPGHGLLDPRHQISSGEVEYVFEEKHDQDENDDSLDRLEWVALNVHQPVHGNV